MPALRSYSCLNDSELNNLFVISGDLFTQWIWQGRWRNSAISYFVCGGGKTKLYKKSILTESEVSGFGKSKGFYKKGCAGSQVAPIDNSC